MRSAKFAGAGISELGADCRGDLARFAVFPCIAAQVPDFRDLLPCFGAIADSMRCFLLGHAPDFFLSLFRFFIFALFPCKVGLRRSPVFGVMFGSWFVRKFLITGETLFGTRSQITQQQSDKA